MGVVTGFIMHAVTRHAAAWHIQECSKVPSKVPSTKVYKSSKVPSYLLVCVCLYFVCVFYFRYLFL